MTATPNTSQDSLNFLIEILQKISENNNPKLIYPFLAQNLDKLNENLINVLNDWSKNTLSHLNQTDAYSITLDLIIFCNRLSNFPLGNIAINLEIAITGYKIALNVFTFDDFPQDWAATQNNLANAYSDRIRGDKAENLEKAIAYYQEALKVRTFDNFPQDWAMTQNNLANAYFYRIRGDKAENLEKAIAYYQEALKVYTFDDFPQQWAMTQNNLALTYSDRIRGDKAENLEKAVKCYQNAMKGYETAGDWLNAAAIGLTLGKMEADRGEWYQGLAYLEKSLNIYRQFDDLKNRADTIYQVAHIHHLIGNHEKAATYYRDAFRFYDYLKNRRGVAFCKASLGRLMLQIGFIEKAQELLNEATLIFKELNNEQEIAKIAEVLNCITKIKEKQSV